MKIQTKAILITLSLSISSQLAGGVITFFMRPYPYLSPEEKTLTLEQAEKKSQKLRRPEKHVKYTLRSILESNSASGIFATYMGQLALSDANGQISFSRRQENPHVRLLITEKINPILMAGQTVHHWEIESEFPARLYLIEQKDDQETELEFWDVKEIELPKNKHILLDTVIVFAKPSHIVVPTGITIIEKEAQLLLPDLYVKKNIDKLSSSLYVLDLKRFFSQTKKSYEVKEQNYSGLLE